MDFDYCNIRDLSNENSEFYKEKAPEMSISSNVSIYGFQ